MGMTFAGTENVRARRNGCLGVHHLRLDEDLDLIKGLGVEIVNRFSISLGHRVLPKRNRLANCGSRFLRPLVERLLGTRHHPLHAVSFGKLPAACDKGLAHADYARWFRLHRRHHGAGLGSGIASRRANKRALGALDGLVHFLAITRSGSARLFAPLRALCITCCSAMPAHYR